MHFALYRPYGILYRTMTGIVYVRNLIAQYPREQAMALVIGPEWKGLWCPGA